MPVTTSNDSSATQHPEGVPIQQKITTDSNFYLLTKRVMDVCFAVLGLMLLMPVMLLVMLLIKLEDKEGPVLFKQIRIGKDGNPFYMYKFRSMVTNAEELKGPLMELNEAEGPVFKIKEDPRVTKIGKVIRRTSLDELPQLFNVLEGSMSLVGPRPPLPEEVIQYNNYELQRLQVVPGLTCYWQVSGRSNIEFAEWVQLDLQYMKERNIFVDLKLIVKTVFVLFGSKDAY